MRHGCLLGTLLGALLWGLFRPAPAAAGDLLGWLRGDHRSYTAEYLSGAEPGVALAPGPQPYPSATVHGPRPGCVPSAPSFNWGYFGAPYVAPHFCHKGYHGDCAWWHYRRRY